MGRIQAWRNATFYTAPPSTDRPEKNHLPFLMANVAHNFITRPSQPD
jgi:hypothetical protein